MANVMILTGSDSDLPVIRRCYDALIDLGIDAELHVASAHRTPQRVQALVHNAEQNGCRVFIASAGGAAHLAGAVAAQTTRPVIGVPLAAGALGGVDALYSTVNMPPGMPVATVSVGEWGARNAALLAAQILAVADEDLAELLRAKREDQRSAVERKDAELQQQLKDES